MFRGKIVAIVPSENATKEYIGLLMAVSARTSLELPTKTRKSLRPYMRGVSLDNKLNQRSRTSADLLEELTGSSNRQSPPQ